MDNVNVDFFPYFSDDEFGEKTVSILLDGEESEMVFLYLIVFILNNWASWYIFIGIYRSSQHRNECKCVCVKKNIIHHVVQVAS